MFFDNEVIELILFFIVFAAFSLCAMAFVLQISSVRKRYKELRGQDCIKKAVEEVFSQRSMLPRLIKNIAACFFIAAQLFVFKMILRRMPLVWVMGFASVYLVVFLTYVVISSNDKRRKRFIRRIRRLFKPEQKEKEPAKERQAQKKPIQKKPSKGSPSAKK
ncbi:hypothetical protein [Lancefieldella rimae]|uniref:hypothetical protein n=1 Tax=Lancefieldella rimae TaxID=1383 RepID=UPI001CAAE2C0|nr:hypothetical protein [Lancefieldella rimae]MBF4804153.1 hypothetical protein [Lancefieldella rimae]